MLFKKGFKQASSITQSQNTLENVWTSEDSYKLFMLSFQFLPRIERAE